MRMNKGKPFMHVEADSRVHPTFSEAFLYPTVGKGDARFILGVAEEYEHIIEALGPKAVMAILDVKPRLVNRLGTGEKVCEWLEDAARDQYRRDLPSQVIIDEEAAHSVWEVLHDEYATFFNPEESMSKDRLRLYHKLTDELGPWENEQRKAEQDRLPEKLERQAEREKELPEKRKRRAASRKAPEVLEAALNGGGDRDEALRLCAEAFGVAVAEPVE